MGDSIRDELRGVAARFHAAADKYPDFRLAIMTGPVLTAEGLKPGEPTLLAPPGLSAEAEPIQRRAAELLDLLASEAVPILTRAGVDIGNADAIEPVQLVWWAADRYASFNVAQTFGEGRGTTGGPSEYRADNELLMPKANIFVLLAYAIERAVLTRDAQRQSDEMWQARLDMWRDLFGDDWLFDALREVAGLTPGAPVGPDAPHENNLAWNAAWEKYEQGTRSGDERIGAILRRALGEWQELTGLPPLGYPSEAEGWRTAGVAARVPEAEIDKLPFTEIARRVRRWAVSLKAERNRKAKAAVPTTARPLSPGEALMQRLKDDPHEMAKVQKVQETLIERGKEAAEIIEAYWASERERYRQLFAPSSGMMEIYKALQPIPAGKDETTTTAHSIDFRSVRWFHTPYTFTETQAACVKVLWEHWKQGTPAVGEQTILETAGAIGDRLRDVFRGHEAWGTMIKPAGKGAFQLVELTIS